MQQADGISFVDPISMTLRIDVELVECTVAGAGDEAFPDAGCPAGSQAMCFGIPSIETADHRNGARVGGPDAEDGSGPAIVGHEVGAHFVVNAVVAALVEEVEVVF